jgi:hypothetical protein
MLEFLAEYAKPLIMLGVSTVGSLASGKAIKDKTKIDNDQIPVANGATWGTAGLVVGNQGEGDPLTMASGFAGAVLASLIHKGASKIRKED